uniref:Uncharacterized protein n=1 Tax=viral metagenome TaxID=1070528 RepID=A0A6C0E006_9ZZZZ
MFVNLIIIGIIIIISYYIYQNKCDMSLKYILYSLCAIMVINQLQKIMSKDLGEFFTPADANEAIQNIASIYNKSNMTVDNLTITGNLDVKGKSTLSNLGVLGGFAVNGLSTLSGIANHNGLTSDNITIKPDNALIFPSSDNSKATWKYFNNNNNELQLTNSVNQSKVRVVTNPSGNGTLQTIWSRPDGNNDALVGLVPAANTSRGTHDGYMYVGHTSGPNWST